MEVDEICKEVLWVAAILLLIALRFATDRRRGCHSFPMIHFVGFRFLKEIGESEREGEVNSWKTRKITKEEILAGKLGA